MTVYFSDSMTGVLSRCINSLQLQDEFNSDSTEKSESDNANLLLKKVRKNFVLENSKWNRFEFCSICAKALDGVNFHRFSDQLTTSRLLRIPARRFSSSSLTESSRSVVKRFFFASLCPSCAPALAIVWLRVASNVASCHFDRQHCLIWRKAFSCDAMFAQLSFVDIRQTERISNACNKSRSYSDARVCIDLESFIAQGSPPHERDVETTSCQQSLEQPLREATGTNLLLPVSVSSSLQFDEANHFQHAIKKASSPLLVLPACNKALIVSLLIIYCDKKSLADFKAK